MTFEELQSILRPMYKAQGVPAHLVEALVSGKPLTAEQLKEYGECECNW